MKQKQNLSAFRWLTCVQSMLCRCAVRDWMDLDIGATGVLQPTQLSWISKVCRVLWMCLEMLCVYIKYGWKILLPRMQASPTYVPCSAVPTRGPEFWRMIDEAATNEEKNVTLLWKVVLLSLLFLNLTVMFQKRLASLSMLFLGTAMPDFISNLICGFR